MIAKKKLLQDAKIYLILDTNVNSYDQLLDLVNQTIDKGVDVFQLRDKKGSARDILEFSKEVLKVTQHRVPYILNDRADLAFACQADGVHVGQDDLSYQVARAILGPDAIIGVSCQTLEHTQQINQKDVDYIGFGSVFKTLTKPDRDLMDLNLLKEVVDSLSIPVFAIGGISTGNIVELKDIGVQKVAICREVSLASDPVKVLEHLRAVLCR
jgi:thiamine-phosphate pyrophosphorylase